MSVKIYTTYSCVWCGRAKEFFKQNNIDFQEVNVEYDVEALNEMIEKSGQLGVPVIDVNGTIIIGYDKVALEAALGLKK